MSAWMMLVALLAVGLGFFVATWRGRSRNERLEPSIRQALANGPLTLPELARAIAMDSFFGRGKVALAVGQMQQDGAIVVMLAPEGTPQLQKIDHIRYRLVR